MWSRAVFFFAMKLPMLLFVFVDFSNRQICKLLLGGRVYK